MMQKPRLSTGFQGDNLVFHMIKIQLMLHNIRHNKPRRDRFEGIPAHLASGSQCTSTGTSTRSSSPLYWPCSCEWCFLKSAWRHEQAWWMWPYHVRIRRDDKVHYCLQWMSNPFARCKPCSHPAGKPGYSSIAHGIMFWLPVENCWYIIHQRTWWEALSLTYVVSVKASISRDLSHRCRRAVGHQWNLNAQIDSSITIQVN